jgi:hypothetical protein
MIQFFPVFLCALGTFIQQFTLISKNLDEIVMKPVEITILPNQNS